MHQTVLKVVSIYGKFVSHSFKRDGVKTMQCDVPILGSFYMEVVEDAGAQRKMVYDFVPSMSL